MTQVQNFPRERFTEMTDGNLSTKASVLGWPAGSFPEEFTIELTPHSPSLTRARLRT